MRFFPRFVNDGTAVALGGYIRRVNTDVVRRNLPLPSASTSDDGSSQSGPYNFRHDPKAEPVVSFRSSSTKTWLEWEDADDSAQEPTHTVHSQSSIYGLDVEKRLFVERATAYLKTVFRAGDPQPTITPVKTETNLDGLTIDGVPFMVDLDSKPFRTFGRCHEFNVDSSIRKTLSNRLQSLTGKGLLVSSIVRRIEPLGKLPDGAEVDEHVIVWPNFGKIILGELLISDFSRRLTMVRLELGSPVEGSMQACDIVSGGQGLP